MDLITEAGIEPTGIVFGFSFLFKIVFGLMLILYIAYSYFLALRVRILADSVKTPWNKRLQRLAFFHLYAVIVVGLLALLLIVVA
jgi:hypothetical protein